ncbi:hypothetical protein Tco_0713608 [Tanacetum coccineum]
MAFVSSSSSTNEVNTAYGVSTANIKVNPTSTQVSIVSTQVRYANLRVTQLDMTNPSECFNMPDGTLQGKCRGPRNQDSRNRNQDSSRKTINVEETSSKAMVAIDGSGFD